MRLFSDIIACEIHLVLSLNLSGPKGWYKLQPKELRHQNTAVIGVRVWFSDKTAECFEKAD